MGLLTEEDIALLREPHLAHVATTMPDGTPHVTPVWVDTDGEHILINTAKGRVKHRNIVRNPAVGVSVADGSNFYRTLWVQGTARLIDEGAEDHINKLAHKYMGKDYPALGNGEERVIVEITVTKHLGRR